MSDGWPVGSRLPSEAALAAELGVGRSTVREAIRALASTGLVASRQGAGTFVPDRDELVRGRRQPRPHLRPAAGDAGAAGHRRGGHRRARHPGAAGRRGRAGAAAAAAATRHRRARHRRGSRRARRLAVLGLLLATTLRDPRSAADADERQPERSSATV